MARTKKSKVVQLKTMQQLRADLVLREEELLDARGEAERLSKKVEGLIAARDRDKQEMASLIMKIRDTVYEKQNLGPLPIRTRIWTMLFPEFMLQQAVRTAQSNIGTKIRMILANHHYETNHAAPIQAQHTTITSTPVVEEATGQ